jgi:hypothetical protein
VYGTSARTFPVRRPAVLKNLYVRRDARLPGCLWRNGFRVEVLEGMSGGATAGGYWLAYAPE